MNNIDELKEVILIALQDKANLFKNYNSDYIEGILDGLAIAQTIVERI